MTPFFPPSLAALLDRGASLVAPRSAGELGLVVAPVLALSRAALEAPIGSPRLAALCTPRSRVVVVISDATRDEPRMEMLAAIREELARVPDERITIVIASGTHAPRPPSTVVSADVLERHPVLVHDGADLAAMVDLGVTPEGTRVRIARCVAEADVVVSTGRIRPHYFAGYSGGAKGIFPGCAHGGDARQNHLFKADPSARLGRLDDNRCRVDLEHAARLVRGAVFLLNAVADLDGGYVAAFAGDLVSAHRAACAAARPLFVAEGPRARVVVTSDLPPVTDSLYQASKLLPPAGALLEAGGTAVVVASCPEGIGPIETVNKGIYELGVRHHLPEGHRVRLVSDMPERLVAQSYATHSASLHAALTEAGFGASLDGVTLAWRAGELIAEASR